MEQTSQEFKWAEARHFGFSLQRDPCVRMNSNSKSANSIAIKAEIKRHASLQSAINRLSKQFERVADQQLRSGLKVYLRSIEGKVIFVCLLIFREESTCMLINRWSEFGAWLDSQGAHFNAILNLINGKNLEQTLVHSEFSDSHEQQQCQGVGKHDSVGDWYLPLRFLCQSVCLFRGSRCSFSFSFHSEGKRFTSRRLVRSVVAFISQPLDTGIQRHHLSAAAIAMAAGWNLLCGLFPVYQFATALKATSFQTSGAFTREADLFYIISSIATSHRFLLMWPNVLLVNSLSFFLLICNLFL